MQPKPSSSCIHATEVKLSKKRARANISTFWSLRTEVYQAPPRSMQLQTTGNGLLQIKTGLRKDERSLVSDME